MIKIKQWIKKNENEEKVTYDNMNTSSSLAHAFAGRLIHIGIYKY